MAAVRRRLDEFDATVVVIDLPVLPACGEQAGQAGAHDAVRAERFRRAMLGDDVPLSWNDRPEVDTILNELNGLK